MREKTRYIAVWRTLFAMAMESPACVSARSVVGDPVQITTTLVTFPAIAAGPPFATWQLWPAGCAPTVTAYCAPLASGAGKVN